jgi:peptidoglycan/xylan/chitin deacetylase (PgdA/CDA1 family)
MRPPYGEITPAQRVLIEREFGYRTTLWTLDSRDWQLRDADAITQHVLGSIREGSVVLVHDIHRETIEAMRIIFKEIALAGFDCVSVSELRRQ